MFVFSLTRSLKLLSTCALVTLLTACATPMQWGPELQLRHLCRTEGGVVVHQAPTEEAFVSDVEDSQRPAVPPKKYYVKTTSTTVRADCAADNCIRILKVTTYLHRRSDDALMASYTNFSRLGGDFLFSTVNTCGPVPFSLTPYLNDAFNKSKGRQGH